LTIARIKWLNEEKGKDVHKKLFLIAAILLVACSNLYGENKKQAINLVVKTHLGAGFFAELTKVIAVLIHHEDEMQKVWVDWTNEFFPYKDKPSENGWDLYFDPIVAVDMPLQNDAKDVACDHGYHEIHDQICSEHWLAYDLFFPYRQFVHEKIKKYICIKQPILDFVESFYQRYMKNSVCIGVHVRFAQGHYCEVPGGALPELQDYFYELDVLLQKHKNENVIIYVATDSHQALKIFKERYPSILHIDAFRASGREDPHLIYENTDFWVTHPEEWHRRKPGFLGGVPVLYDCLLLSRCNYLIHTTSNVSSFVVFFNPLIKSIFVPKTAPLVRCNRKNDKSIKNYCLNPV